MKILKKNLGSLFGSLILTKKNSRSFSISFQNASNSWFFFVVVFFLTEEIFVIQRHKTYNAL